MSTMSARLIKLYQGAPREVRTAGKAWYTLARAEARSIARDNGTTQAVAAGVIAALSPRIHWVRNVKVARQAVAGEAVTGVFRVNLNKAIRIVNGEQPLKVLSGPKTRAFYRAIMGDETAAVVDVWMLRAVNWSGTKLSPSEYQTITLAMGEAARATRTTVARMQAVVWTVVRGSAT